MNKEIIKQIIIDTINGEEHLGENLKKQCIEYIEELQQQNQKQKEVIDKAIKYINDNLTISSILDGKKYYTINDYSFDYMELLNILKEDVE